MSSDTAELRALLQQAVDSLRARGRTDDPGSLLKIGRLEARLRAIEALAPGDERIAIAAALKLEFIAGFPATLSHAAPSADEDLHLAFEAIGRRYLSGDLQP